MHSQAHEIRSLFSSAMSDMYRLEVPQYGKLLDLVANINQAALRGNEALSKDVARLKEFGRLEVERHGAIRLGTPGELGTIRRIFRVMGMFPVSYYDLSTAGIPVHSTAFRPVDLAELNKNPFRVFTSLLRLDLIESDGLRAEARRLLDERKIFTGRALELTNQYEKTSKFSDPQAEEFVSEVVETFKWHREATVDAGTYNRLNELHRLIADIVCFKGPHINHLTPRTLDIDEAQVAMVEAGLSAKNTIEGPPRRKCPILLRQTSFKAIEEQILFKGADSGGCLNSTCVDQAGLVEGSHTARFGEIEQRGVALTPRGRELYDRLLNEVREKTSNSSPNKYAAALEKVFQKFPDDYTTLRREGLAYFKYSVSSAKVGRGSDIDSLVEQGAVIADPITYEDFLPVSAAGIFRSNLNDDSSNVFKSNHAKSEFEVALGAPTESEFDIYDRQERGSLAEVKRSLKLEMY